jgi:hypothetical protein
MRESGFPCACYYDEVASRPPHGASGHPANGRAASGHQGAGKAAGGHQGAGKAAGGVPGLSLFAAAGVGGGGWGWEVSRRMNHW